MEEMTYRHLRDNLADTLNRVQYQGSRIVVTRRGKPVARLVPLEDPVSTAADIPDTVTEWAAARKVPLNPPPAEPITIGPWAEWDGKRGALYLGEWMVQLCPRCGQSDRPHAPLVPPSGHADWNRQHGCGEWWAPAEVKATGLTIESLDVALAELRNEERQARERVWQQLRADLVEFLALPADEHEATGSETEPGIYQEGGEWMAWDYDPITEGETITVYADEINR